MWTFSQAAFVFGASAANVDAMKPTAGPNATSTETSFARPLSFRNQRLLLALSGPIAALRSTSAYAAPPLGAR